uniref:Uncharacterized protein n=1 Tax=Picea glauca TaxID=3330 RepID=A0A101M249_PICGL|nr:hypothetical protein ABT39_MTgene4036 [Picea glauca]
MTWDLDPELLLSLSLVLVLRNKQDQQVMLLNGNISASSQANDIYLSTPRRPAKRVSESTKMATGARY